MTFAKDILVLDFEGFDFPKQVGAVLLDKETLEEKDNFSSYIYGDMRGRAGLKNNITQEMLDAAPMQAEVGKMLYEKFGTNIFLASFTSNLDMSHFQTLMRAARIDFKDYDYHVLDVWPIAYAHLIKSGYTGGFRSDDIFKAFGLKKRGSHDALEDARLAAEVLRAVLKI